MDKNQCLEVVLAEMRTLGPNSDFSGEVFVRVLELLPAAPSIPAKAFFPLSKKLVGSYIDYVIVKDGKVLMTLREKGDPYYKGWHFPGFCRTPGISPLVDCQGKAAGELGENFKILEVEEMFFRDHWDDPSGRPHHETNFYQVTRWEGEPSKGQWFSEMPEGIIPLHAKVWPRIEHLLKA